MLFNEGGVFELFNINANFRTYNLPYNSVNKIAF